MKTVAPLSFQQSRLELLLISLQARGGQRHHSTGIQSKLTAGQYPSRTSRILYFFDALYHPQLRPLVIIDCHQR